MNIIKILQNIVHKGTPHYKGSTVDADVHLQGADLDSLAARGLVELNAAQPEPAKPAAAQPEAPKEPEKAKTEEKVEESKPDVATPDKPADTQAAAQPDGSNATPDTENTKPEAEDKPKKNIFGR